MCLRKAWRPTSRSPTRLAGRVRISSPLGAYGSVNVKAAISITGTSGLTIAANVANTGGLFRLVGVGKISFWDTSSTLVINSKATPYTLVNNLPALSAAVAANPSGAYALRQRLQMLRRTGPIRTRRSLRRSQGALKVWGARSPIWRSTAPTRTPRTTHCFLRWTSTAVYRMINLTNVSMQTIGGNTGGARSHEQWSHRPFFGSRCDNRAQWRRQCLSCRSRRLEQWHDIPRSRAAVDLSFAEYAGGLVTFNTGTISLSGASGTIYAGEAGGLASQSSGTIQNSYALGSVTTGGSADAGGGLVARNSGAVSECFATGDVYATALPFPHHRRSSKEDRHKLPGLVLGGLLGTSAGSVFDSYATGSVIGKATRKYAHNEVGGLIGGQRGGTP